MFAVKCAQCDTMSPYDNRALFCKSRNILYGAQTNINEQLVNLLNKFVGNCKNTRVICLNPSCQHTEKSGEICIRCGSAVSPVYSAKDLHDQMIYILKNVGDDLELKAISQRYLDANSKYLTVNLELVFAKFSFN